VRVQFVPQLSISRARKDVAGEEPKGAESSKEADMLARKGFRARARSLKYREANDPETEI